MTASTVLRREGARTPEGTSPRARRPFQTDIEGLRALAVIAVVAFHASIPGVRGGFIGVDVFFVISGYLISGQLIRELLSTGRVRLAAFYVRRAKRLLPAATIVLAAALIATALLEPLLGVYHTAQDLLAATFYTTNWHFISLGTDYLAQSTSNSPVLHFWSLAVEEQFYLAWPLLLIGASFLAGKVSRNATRVFLVVIVVISALSLAAGIILTMSDPKLAYMATQTRAWEFGVGAAVAVAAQWLSVQGVTRLGNVAGIVLGWTGIAAVISAIIFFDAKTPFPGYAALLPTLGTAAIIAGGLIVGVGRTTVGSVLSLRPVRYIGRLSYSWYLWHWPVLILVEVKTGTLTWPMRSLLMVVALLLAVATLHLVEVPISRWKAVATRTGPAFALGLLCMVTTTALILGIGGHAVNDLATSATQTKTTTLRAAFGADTGVDAGPVTPSALKASKDIPTPDGCLLDHEPGKVVSCVIGPTDGLPVVLFGDSHAHQWLPTISQIAWSRHWRLTVFAKAGCPVPNMPVANDGSRSSAPDCVIWRQASIKMITHKVKPSLIFVGSLDLYIADSGESLALWNDSLDKLRVLGVPIVYIRDTPGPRQDVPTCISSALDNWSKCAFAPRNLQEPVIQQTLIGNEPDVTVVDMYRYFCSTKLCPAVKNGVLLYRDNSHISATAATALVPEFDKALSSVLPKLKKPTS